MIRIPGGIVRIGSSATDLDWLESEGQAFPREWFSDETPQIDVRIAEFEIDPHPVTNEAFGEFVADTGYRTDAEQQGWGMVYGDRYWVESEGACWRSPGGRGTHVAERPDHPAVHISWQDATQYASWAGKRLPTEFEWEYAARGPLPRRWPWGDSWDRNRCNAADWHLGEDLLHLDVWRAWWDRQRERHGGLPMTTPVGSFLESPPAAFNLADASGNVYEWTESLCKPYREGAKHPVYGRLEGLFRVLRGGSWMNFRYQCRPADRMYGDPFGWSNFATGFRCARDV
ncbi:SUMF1/EgtB/PvdO family nonheme iron enzyme [Curtobacterium sp. MEB011]|uniref:formylglycine-generating enzyme family protein n=1 Tax=Curtobacterium sp. MEB011 TaxID=3040285 RepID=UPI002549C81D|nr:SUMF1/EgtB/PvdO family nonheme iron enzyme [Curtobacterium sp. MEB011]